MVGPRGTPGAFTRGASRVRPGSAPGPPGVCLRGYVRVRPGRSRAVPGRACRGPLRARVPAASRTTMRVPATYDRAGPRPRTTVRGRAAYDRVGPAGIRPGRPPTGTDRTRFGSRTTRTGPAPGRAGLDRAGRGRTDRAAPRTTERPRPGERPAYDRGGPPPCMTCAGSARVRPRGSAPVHDPRGVRTAHDRVGFELRTTARGSDRVRPSGSAPVGDLFGAGRVRPVRSSDRARPCRVRTVHDPCGARTVHHRAGLGPCATWVAFARIRPRRALGPVRPRGSAQCAIARVRPRSDRAEPGRVRPCEAPAAYGPGVFRLCSTVWGLPRVRPRAGLRPRTT